MHVPDKGHVIVDHLELGDQAASGELHHSHTQIAIDARLGGVPLQMLDETRVQHLQFRLSHLRSLPR
jgi:hypothetical protein